MPLVLALPASLPFPALPLSLAILPPLAVVPPEVLPALPVDEPHAGMAKSLATVLRLATDDATVAPAPTLAATWLVMVETWVGVTVRSVRRKSTVAAPRATATQTPAWVKPTPDLSIVAFSNCATRLASYAAKTVQSTVAVTVIMSTKTTVVVVVAVVTVVVIVVGAGVGGGVGPGDGGGVGGAVGAAMVVVGGLVTAAVTAAGAAVEVALAL